VGVIIVHEKDHIVLVAQFARSYRSDQTRTDRIDVLLEVTGLEPVCARRSITREQRSNHEYSPRPTTERILSLLQRIKPRKIHAYSTPQEVFDAESGYFIVEDAA
jgi:hypothetical protein